LKIEIRRAREVDKEPLMEFIKHVWGGHDYIPYVWDSWIADRRAKMFVLLADGRQVGMNRMRQLPDGSVWMEGVRVHPDYRGKGLAGMLGENSMKVGRKGGATVFRLTSNARNRAAHRQVAKLGFREISRLSTYEPKKGQRFAPQKGVETPGPGMLREVATELRGTKEFGLGAGVYWDGFTATALTDGVIGKLLADGAILTCEGAIAVSKVGGEGRMNWRQVGFLGGESGGAKKLVRHAFGRKEEVKTTWRLAYMFRGSPLIPAVKEAGLARTSSLVLFERRASQ
jgi:ribosomal protein S18 acetylase RimI-like enzyme